MAEIAAAEMSCTIATTLFAVRFGELSMGSSAFEASPRFPVPDESMAFVIGIFSVGGGGCLKFNKQPIRHSRLEI
jgi:hypothetical protein